MKKDDYHGDQNGNHDLDDQNGDQRVMIMMIHECPLMMTCLLLRENQTGELVGKKEHCFDCLHPQGKELFSDKDIALAVRRKVY